MFGIADFVVGLWFLPVTLFIILPLAIMIGWHLVMFVLSPGNRKRGEPDQPIREK